MNKTGTKAEVKARQLKARAEAYSDAADALEVMGDIVVGSVEHKERLKLSNHLNRQAVKNWKLADQLLEVE